MYTAEIPNLDLRTSWVRNRTMIYKEGQVCDRFFVVRDGRVLVGAVDNTKGVVDIIGQNELLGTEVIAGSARYRYSALTYPDCQIQAIPRSELPSLYAQYPDLQSRIFSSSEEQTARIIARMDTRLKKGSLASLAMVIRELADPELRVFGVSQQVIGQMAMMETREATNKHLGKMKDRGVIEVAYVNIKVKDEAHLAYIAETGSFQPAYAR